MYLCDQFFIFYSTMKFEDTNILLARPLLWFDQSCGSFYADNQTTCYFRIKCSTVPSFLYTQNSLHPWYNLMWWRVCWFVKIDKTTPTKHIVYQWIMVNISTSLTCVKKSFDKIYISSLKNNCFSKSYLMMFNWCEDLLEIFLNWSFQWGVSSRNGCVVCSSDIQFVKILQTIRKWSNAFNMCIIWSQRIIHF